MSTQFGEFCFKNFLNSFTLSLSFLQLSRLPWIIFNSHPTSFPASYLATVRPILPSDTQVTFLKWKYKSPPCVKSSQWLPIVCSRSRMKTPLQSVQEALWSGPVFCIYSSRVPLSNLNPGPQKSVYSPKASGCSMYLQMQMYIFCICFPFPPWHIPIYSERLSPNVIS